ncbi:MAG TPA: tRNA-dihydrouridine synthase family protein [Acetivibrio clariflavus]|nr:tRNA-dihydrouridine synthase family protein [Acetivibrio clariflavus]HPU41494.1 tRNA-dihydrouridine synthase family protein [Acetivibrio clariflavus]
MKIFLAPLQGMTVAGYRNAFARHFGGIDAYYSPFIATSEINKVNKLLLKDILQENNDPAVKLIPQILGNNGMQFKFFAEAISGLGYYEINWNIGCPYPTVTSKKKGAGMLPYPDMIKSFLDNACSGNSYVVTVKMRLGMESLEEGMRVIEVLNDYPLGRVIIHARTGIQKYDGNVDLEAFIEMASSCKHEITYNGDIFTYEDYLRISMKIPFVKSFMLGRGALINPFLPSEIKGNIVAPENKINIIRAFHNEIFDYYRNRVSGDKHLCDKMMEFWSYMSVNLDRDGKFMKKLKKCRNASHYLELVNQLLGTDSGWTDAILS